MFSKNMIVKRTFSFSGVRFIKNVGTTVRIPLNHLFSEEIIKTVMMVIYELHHYPTSSVKKTIFSANYQELIVCE